LGRDNKDAVYFGSQVFEAYHFLRTLLDFDDHILCELESLLPEK